MSFTIAGHEKKILFDDNLKQRFVTHQNYSPMYKKYFSHSVWDSFTLKYPVVIESLKSTSNYNCFVGETCDKSNLPIFAKFCPLFDSSRYLIGKTTPDMISLPKPEKDDHHFANSNNTAYADSFFSYLTSQLLHKHGFVNGLDCYGSSLALYSNYRVDIQDEIEYLFESEYFLEHRDEFKISDDLYQHFVPTQSCKYKKKLRLSNEDIKIDIEEYCPEIMVDNNSFKSSDLIYIKDYSLSNETGSSTCSSRSSITTYDDECSNETDTIYSSDNENDIDEEIPIYAYIKEFPVNMVLLEACKETLDEYMLNNEVDECEWSAIFMQVIMSLVVLQEKLLFVHNDLHNSNIMYITTEQKYLYYKYDNKHYKVPTYGKIWKLIDFGRAIYKFKGNVVFSDCFSEDGEASTQYNCEPYLNPNKKIVPPNFSFDLCRLACSMYDYFETNTQLSNIKEIISKWMKDDKGRNILYKNNGDERYPDFKLYKMISRTVHHHIPNEQLTHSLFSQYSISKKNIKKNKKIMNIDDIPVYYD
tara:strand:+ start:7724 stop:9310 length:1587 start_codon:yes stop_codon:yes gene_type:complete